MVVAELEAHQAGMMGMMGMIVEWGRREEGLR